jgi:hypothetical protein
VVVPDRVQSAVAFSIKCPNATIPQCMLACGFSKKEVADRAQRMAVYRHLNDLVELGLAVRDPMSGKVTIAEDQLRNIINLDETALSLDGSTQNKGGRPEMILSDPRFTRRG